MGPKKVVRKDSAAVKVTADLPGRTCEFCHRGRATLEEDLLESGGFFRLEGRYFHYFCVLFSSRCRIAQEGRDDEGLFGFFLRDILKELQAAERVLCKYCRRRHASATCDKCKTSFHFSCGVAAGCAFVFSGFYKSYCPAHRPAQAPSLLRAASEDRTCVAGCLEEVGTGERSVVCPHCFNVSHLDCLQRMAQSSGREHYRCPTCNDKEEFTKQSVKVGIYVPEKDADWEAPDLESFYNFNRMGRLHQQCNVKKCLCPKGREYHMAGTDFEIIRCSLCGGKGAHIKCGKLVKRCPEFICDDHETDPASEPQVGGPDTEETETQGGGGSGMEEDTLSSESSDEGSKTPTPPPTKKVSPTTKERMLRSGKRRPSPPEGSGRETGNPPTPHISGSVSVLELLSSESEEEEEEEDHPRKRTRSKAQSTTGSSSSTVISDPPRQRKRPSPKQKKTETVPLPEKIADKSDTVVDLTLDDDDDDDDASTSSDDRELEDRILQTEFAIRPRGPESEQRIRTPDLDEDDEVREVPAHDPAPTEYTLKKVNGRLKLVSVGPLSAKIPSQPPVSSSPTSSKRSQEDKSDPFGSLKESDFVFVSPPSKKPKVSPQLKVTEKPQSTPLPTPPPRNRPMPASKKAEARKTASTVAVFSSRPTSLSLSAAAASPTPSTSSAPSTPPSIRVIEFGSGNTAVKVTKKFDVVNVDSRGLSGDRGKQDKAGDGSFSFFSVRPAPTISQLLKKKRDSTDDFSQQQKRKNVITLEPARPEDLEEDEEEAFPFTATIASSTSSSSSVSRSSPSSSSSAPSSGKKKQISLSLSAIVSSALSDCTKQQQEVVELSDDDD